MPSLLNFMKSNGTLITNEHTPLIAHTSDDIITMLTGVYPSHHGVANAANSYQYYKATGTTGFQSAFTYWTDTIPDGTYNLISGPTDSGHPNGVNAPAPWVPFTRAGCDVGAAGAADMELENTGVDLTTVFGAGSPETTDPNAFANYEGVAIHCAATSTLCSSANGGYPDKLPWEPYADGSSAATDANTGTSTAYEGFNALFGHKYITQAFRTLGLSSQILDGNGNLKDINGNTIVDDFRGTLTPGFPGFSLPPQYALGYTADMVEAGVPVVYSYIITPHRPLPVNPYGYGHSEDHNDYGPGEQHYVDQLKQFDQSFSMFFARLASDGITPANTLFIIGAEEGDHVVAANPTNAPCDGVTKACTYGNTPGNEVGELALNFQGLLQAESGITTSASVTNDSAPDIYLTNNPVPNDPALRAYEQASGTLTATNQITGATDTIAQAMADPAEFKLLHMLTSDALRTPSFTIFANPDYYTSSVMSNANCGTSLTPATDCVAQTPGFAWDHGDIQPEITTTWLGMVGPGVASTGQDDTTWSDHTDIRPTMLTLLGLNDDYHHEGRSLTEKFSPYAVPQGVKNSDDEFLELAVAFKQINAPLGQLAKDSVKISTAALKGDSATYANLEGKLASITTFRDSLSSQMLPLLEKAEFNGGKITELQEIALTLQARLLIAYVHFIASGL
jgi:hypothetical protein